MQNEKLIDFIERVNYSSPIGFKRVLNKYGATGVLEPQNAQESIEAMQLLINEYGNIVINDLLRVHPDRNLFASFYNGGNMQKSPFRNIDMSTGFPTGFYFDTQGNNNIGASIPQQEPMIPTDIADNFEPQIQMRPPESTFASQKIEKLEKEIASTRKLLKYFAIGAVLVLILK